MYRKLEESEFWYRKLRESFPKETVFYSIYYDGSYYDRAYTEYYDEDKNLIHTEMHDYYG